MLSTARFLTISALFILFLAMCMLLNPGAYNMPGELSEDELVRVPGAAMQGGFPPDEKAPAASGADGVSAGEKVDFAIVTGDPAGPASAVSVNALRTLAYMRYPYARFRSIRDCLEAPIDVQTLIVALPEVDEQDVPLLADFLAEGRNVVFAAMPREGRELSDAFKAMLGIVDVEPGYEIEGFRIYQELLLGGMFSAEEWSFTCAKVFLAGTCKVFANGHNPDRDKTALIIDRKDENPLIWRNAYQGGKVFVINAPFLTYSGGSGLLTGICALLNGDFIYPVVGAKTVILESFPYISGGGEYIGNRTVYAFQRDIMWPDLISIATESGIVYTCVTNGGFNQNEQSPSILESFASELYRARKGDLGYAINRDPDIFRQDTELLRDVFSLYNIRGYALPDTGSTPAMDRLPDATALLLPWYDDNAFTWLSDQAVTLPILTRGVGSEQENFNFIGMLSALGLSIHAIDMAKPILDQEGEGKWNLYAVEIAKYFSRQYHETELIPAATLADTAEAVKNYLSAAYVFERTENGLRVTTRHHAGDIKYVLRTEKMVSETVNCTVETLKDGAYLVTSAGPVFELALVREP